MKTLVLFLDAFSFSDFNKNNCPFLYGVAEAGVLGEIEPFPAGYHTEYTMLSGYLPIKHNVWTWYCRKKGSFAKIKYVMPLVRILEKIGIKNRKFVDIYINLIRLLNGKTRFLKTNKIPINMIEKFEISVDKSYVDHNPINVPTFFDILKNEGIKYVAMDYPTISNNKKTSFFVGKDDFKQLDKVKKLLKKNDLVFVHVWKLDTIEHKFGLHSPQAIQHIKKLDIAIRNVVERQNEEIRLVAFSDHGGCNVTKTKNILPLIAKYDVDYFLGSTNCHVWFNNEKDKNIEKLKSELKRKGYLIYDKKNIAKELKIPYHRDCVGDFVAWVKPGEQIYPDFFRDTERVKSMHGYSKKCRELNGVFLMSGFGINKKIKMMQLQDIVPTILKAMKLKIPKDIDGKAKI